MGKLIYVFIRLSLSRQKYDMPHSKNEYIKKCWCSSYRSNELLVSFREIWNFMALNAHHYIISTKFSQNIKLKMPSCQSEQVKKVFTIDLMCTSLTFHEVGWFWTYLLISCISFFVNFASFIFWREGPSFLWPIFWYTSSVSAVSNPLLNLFN